MENTRLTVLDILKQLPKTNCGECGFRACMAFASAAHQNPARLKGCPYLDVSMAQSFSFSLAQQLPPGQTPEQALAEVKDKIRELDFEKRATQLGLELVQDRLRVHVLGKIFDVDKKGDLHTFCHVNYWLHGPILHYILNSQGREPVGDWMPYSRMKGVEETAPFFERRSETELKQLADRDTELFINILETFGEHIDHGLVDADYSVQLMPLPRLPFLFSYWEKEGEFPSRFSIHFDRTAQANLDVRSILFLAGGLTEMFTRFFFTHSGR